MAQKPSLRSKPRSTDCQLSAAESDHALDQALRHTDGDSKKTSRDARSVNPRRFGDVTHLVALIPGLDLRCRGDGAASCHVGVVTGCAGCGELPVCRGGIGRGGGRAGQGRAGQGRAGQGRAGQGRAGTQQCGVEKW